MAREKPERAQLVASFAEMIIAENPHLMCKDWSCCCLGRGEIRFAVNMPKEL